MITAVDTSVLIDVFRNDPQFGIASAEALRQCMQEGRTVVCEVVLAELSAVFPSTQSLVENLEHISLKYLPAEKKNRDNGW